MTETQIIPLNESQNAFIAEQIAFACRICDVLEPTMETVQYLFEYAFDLELYDKCARREEPEKNFRIIDAVGRIFGEEIRKLTNLNWELVIDLYGEEISLVSPSYIQYTSPVSMITRRLQNSDRINLKHFRDSIARDINEQQSIGLKKR